MEFSTDLCRAPTNNPQAAAHQYSVKQAAYHYILCFCDQAGEVPENPKKVIHRLLYLRTKQEHKYRSGHHAKNQTPNRSDTRIAHGLFHVIPRLRRSNASTE